MHCLGNFLKIFQFYRVHMASSLFETCIRNSERSSRKKNNVCGQKFFKLFSVSRGILSVLQFSMPAVCQQNCLFPEETPQGHHELWFSLPGARLGLKGEVDRVINLFFEIRTWADITRCWPALWGVQRWVRSGCYLQEVEHRGWGACIKVWATVPTSETPANLLKRKFPSATPDLMSHKLWGLGPKTWIFFLICG